MNDSETAEVAFHGDDEFQEAGGYFHARRAHIRSILDELAAEIHQTLSAANLPTDVFFTVPSSGESLLTFATLGDPPDDVWAEMNQIVYDIVGDKIGTTLTGREIPCAAVGTSVSAADTRLQEACGNHPENPD
jgi:hypothetical protein